MKNHQKSDPIMNQKSKQISKNTRKGAKIHQKLNGGNALMPTNGTNATRNGQGTNGIH
jgi:hypothetical protein